MARVTQAHIDARTNDILDAALAVFARRGVEAATMQQIAAEAGLSAGATYRYFKNKNDLLRRSFERLLEVNQEAFAAASRTVSSPLEALLALARGATVDRVDIGGADEFAMNLEMALSASRDPAFRPAVRNLFAAVIDLVGNLVRQAQDRGEIEASIDPTSLAVALFCFNRGFGVIWLTLGADLDREAVFMAFAEMARRLAPRPEPRGDA